MDEMYCDALKMALDFERENLNFYQQKLKEVTNPQAQKSLEFLVKEDEEHIAKILKFNFYLLGKIEFDDEKECSSELPIKVKELFQAIIDVTTGKISPTANDIEIYEKAMELENKG